MQMSNVDIWLYLSCHVLCHEYTVIYSDCFWMDYLKYNKCHSQLNKSLINHKINTYIIINVYFLSYNLENNLFCI